MTACPGKPDGFLENWDAAGAEDIQLTLCTNEERQGENGRKGERTETGLDLSATSQGATERQETACKKRAQKRIIIAISLLCFLFSVAIGLLTTLLLMVMENQNLKTDLNQITKEMLSARSNNEQLKQLLNSSQENLTRVLDENYLFDLVLNATLNDVALLTSEKLLLRERVNRTLQEKTSLQEENELLNAAVEGCRLVEEDNRKLIALLNRSLHQMTIASAALQAENKQQRSLLHSNHLSFIWNLCNEDTLQCERCLPGWTEHASRCYILRRDTKNWEDARRYCRSMDGDLAVVRNAADQGFLTNMTFQYVKNNPKEYFHSAWIGLQDMVKETVFLWIDGGRVMPGVIYWKKNEPNNAIASWDTDGAGQDCVAIVPPRKLESEDWLNSWDDITCRGERHFLCERPALILK